MSEPDPYAVFETPVELLTFVAKQEGEPAVQEILDHIISPDRLNPASQEWMHQIAGELEALGFDNLAQLAAETAEKAKPKASLRPHCPYKESDGPHWQYWWKSRGLPVPKRGQYQDP